MDIFGIYGPLFKPSEKEMLHDDCLWVEVMLLTLTT